MMLKMVTFITLLVAIIRIGGYLFTYLNPLGGLLLAFFLDFIDASAFYFVNLSPTQYQLVDKPIDWLQYLILIPLAWKTPVRKWYFAALGFRLVGQTLAFATGNDNFYIFFPNFIEFTLLVYFGLEYIKKLKSTNKIILSVQTLHWSDYRIWLCLLVFKLAQEIGLHSVWFSQNTFILYETLLPR